MHLGRVSVAQRVAYVSLSAGVALSDASSIGACRPRIFFINGFLCFLEDEWQRNEERKRESRRHFKEKMSLEEAHHHRRPWIRAWRKKEMNEGRGREEHEILCCK